jgi:uncharacterized membrane protein
MNIRKVPAQNGIDWLRRAINVGGRNPRAVFGAAALFFVTLYAVAAIAVLPVASRLQGRSALSLGESLAAGIPLLLALAIATPVLLGGLMHVIHEVERGSPARARDLFSMIRQRRAPSLIGLGFVQVALNVAGVLLVVVAAGPDYVLDSIRAVQGAMEGKVITPRTQPNVALLMLLQLVNLLLNYLSVALMLLCVPLIVLSRTGFAESLRSGLRASWVNLAPNLLGGIVFAIAVVIAVVMVTLLSAIVGAIGAFVHPVLGGALALAIWLAFAVVMLVVAVAASYFAWQDMFADAATPPEAAQTTAHFEA